MPLFGCLAHGCPRLHTVPWEVIAWTQQPQASYRRGLGREIRPTPYKKETSLLGVPSKQALTPTRQPLKPWPAIRGKTLQRLLASLMKATTHQCKSRGQDHEQQSQTPQTRFQSLNIRPAWFLAVLKTIPQDFCQGAKGGKAPHVSSWAQHCVCCLAVSQVGKQPAQIFQEP